MAKLDLIMVAMMTMSLEICTMGTIVFLLRVLHRLVFLSHHLGTSIIIQIWKIGMRLALPSPDRHLGLCIHKLVYSWMQSHQDTFPLNNTIITNISTVRH